MRQVLRGAQLVDGTGAPARRADVEIDGGKIVAVGEVAHDSDATEVDLSGLVLSPGFIDIHTHFDAQVFWDRDLTPSGWHGVTTVVQGNCGFGIAPTRPEDREWIMETFENVEGMSLATLRAGIDWGFVTFPEYFARLSALPKRLNLASYVGHTPVRMFVMGAEAASEREATEDEINEMRTIVAEALEAGAIGFSTSQAASHVGARGLPIPSRVCSKEEIRSLLAVAAEAGNAIGSLTYGPEYGLEEAARLSKELNLRMTWGSLLSDLFGPPGSAVDLLERASAIGGDVWPQVSTRFITILVQLSRAVNFFMPLPSFSEVLALRGQDRARVYNDPAWRSRARAEANGERLGYTPKWDKFWVDETVKHGALRGRPLDQVAAERGVDPFDLMIDLAMEEHLETRFRVAVRNSDIPEVTALLKDHRTVIGAHDAGAHIDLICDASYPSYTLGHWVRESGTLTLEEAVWRMSGQPAEIFRLAGRGTVAVGNAADLVAFDPEVITVEPLERVWDFPAHGERLIARNTGLYHSWVNGERIRCDGVDVEGAAPGALVTR